LSREAFEARIIAEADWYTACRFLGCGNYDTRCFESQAKAEASAPGDGRTMIYAVGGSPYRFTIHIRNI